VKLGWGWCCWSGVRYWSVSTGSSYVGVEKRRQEVFAYAVVWKEMSDHLWHILAYMGYVQKVKIDGLCQANIKCKT